MNSFHIFLNYLDDFHEEAVNNNVTGSRYWFCLFFPFLLIISLMINDNFYSSWPFFTLANTLCQYVFLEWSFFAISSGFTANCLTLSSLFRLFRMLSDIHGSFVLFRYDWKRYDAPLNAVIHKFRFFNVKTSALFRRYIRIALPHWVCLSKCISDWLALLLLFLCADSHEAKAANNQCKLHRISPFLCAMFDHFLLL